MASKDTIKHVLYLFRSVTDFPIVAAKRDPDSGEMIAPGTLEAWALALADLSDAEVMAGGQFVLSSMTDDFKRRPMPGDIRKALAESGSKGWAEAWDEIQRRGHLFNKCGGELTSRGLVKPQWSSPEIAAAVSQMGGIKACLEHTDRNLSVIRSQFRDIYQDIQKRKAYQQHKALPQPPKVPMLTGRAVPALGSGSAPALMPDGGVIDLAARREQMAQAQQEAGAEMVRQRLAEVEARKLAEYQAKIATEQARATAYEQQQRAQQAKVLEQQQKAREMARADGIELEKFDIPGVKEA